MSVFLRSIRGVVGEVLRDLWALPLVSERAYCRLDWLLDNVNRYTNIGGHVGIIRQKLIIIN